LKNLNKEEDRLKWKNKREEEEKDFFVNINGVVVSQTLLTYPYASH
jgi:hypothetical protein